MSTKDLAKISLFTALIAVGAFITIPLGPVPFTLQTFFICLAALFLKPIHAALAATLYMIIGLIGIPIFSGFSGGFQSVFSPTFGYIIGFIIQAYVTSKIAHGKKDSKIIMMGLVIGILISYIIGIPYMQFMLNRVNNMNLGLSDALLIGAIPFIIPDLIKAILALIIYKRTYKYVS